jgi:phage FluMu gp28-like protein
VFNSILAEIKHRGNPMGWSHHRVTIEDAIAQGLVEKMNARNDRKIPREHYIEQMRAECLDEEQWLQEYCCQPADGNSSFITHQMITDCESDDCLKDFEYLENCPNPLYLGFDVARKHDLSVIDVGEMIGDVLWDRLRLELTGMTFTEQERELYRLMGMQKIRRSCIDASGLGLQLAERAKLKFGYRVEPVTFTPQVKEELAYPLRTAFEDKKLRIPRDPKLRFDLRGIRKEVSESGNICFTGDGGGGHCDRFWAKALRHYAARPRGGVGAAVG